MVDTDDTWTMTDRRRTTPWVWHKLPTGELKISVHVTQSNKLFTILNDILFRCKIKYTLTSKINTSHVTK